MTITPIFHRRPPGPNWLWLAALLAITYALSGCDKYVSIDPPETQIESVRIFESDLAATSAVTGLYSRIGGSLSILNGGMTYYPGMSADEFYNSVTNADNALFVTNSLQVDNSTGNYGRLWRAAYQYIYQANAVLEGLEGATAMTDSTKAQLKGEMLLTRSLLYFYLINLYGDVPLITRTDYRESQSMPRTPVTTVYNQLVTDLLSAKDLLRDNYPVTNRTRPNRWTAAALLARVYLYRKDWAAAEAEATAVINSGRYTLLPVLTSVFLTTSGETIWQLGKDNANTTEGVSFVPTSTTVKPPFIIYAPLISAFENGDKRKVAWVGKNTVSNVDYYYPAKYKVRVETPITEYYVVFRLAEQYLIRSEARAMQNNVNGGKADLDIIRGRAGLPAATATTTAGLLSALEQERRVELFAEWGHRWLDIIRWGKADAVFGSAKSPNWQSTDALYPIPMREIQANPFLTQNPGY